MLTQELMRAFYWERMREAAQIQRECQARAVDGPSVSPRRGSSGLKVGRPSVPSFVGRVFRSAPTA
jgi:hypothetical protein